MKAVATDTPIGTRIKRARERMRWTQRQLADALGVDRKTVDNWENDRAYPRSSIGALEDVLGIKVDGGTVEEHFRPVSDQLRRLIADTLPGDIEAQRRVIGLLEGTMSWPDTTQGQPQANGGQEQERHAR